jgi:hypothetical protein
MAAARILAYINDSFVLAPGRELENCKLAFVESVMI